MKKKIVSFTLALSLLLGTVPFVASASIPAPSINTNSEVQSVETLNIGLSEVLPDLSNLEKPPASPARKSPQFPMEVTSTGFADYPSQQSATKSLIRGTTTQDNTNLITTNGAMSGSIFYMKSNRTVSPSNPLDCYSHESSVAMICESNMSLSKVATLTATMPADRTSSLLFDLNTSGNENAIGTVITPISWINKQVKIVFLELTVDLSGGILLGYFDPNDFPGGSSNNSDLYLYIDISNYGGFPRLENTPTLFESTVLHEYAHMVNFSVGFSAKGVVTGAAMPIWLDEAIANAVAFNHSNQFEEAYLLDFLEQNFHADSSYVPMDIQWKTAENNGKSNANYGASTLMMLDLLQYDVSSSPMMKDIIEHQPGNRSYTNSLEAVKVAYGATSFNQFFTQFNLDIAVDNEDTSLMTDLSLDYYGFDAVDIWSERYNTVTQEFKGITEMQPGQTYDILDNIGNRAYFSDLYLSEPIGVENSQININIPNAPNTKYFVITPYNDTNIITDSDWISADKQAAQLNSGDNIVTVGTNNRFSVLSVQYDSLQATDNTEFTYSIPVNGINVNPTSLSLVVGSNSTITATVTPSNATNSAVTWSSSDTAMATVDGTGNITAVSAGSAVITATTQDGGFTASCSVTVSTTTIPVTGVNVSPSNMSLVAGGNGSVTANLVPFNATNSAVTWSSSDTAVATVDGTGNITAVSAGSAVITATTQDGGFTASCSVTVSTTRIPVTGVNVSPSNMSLVAGGNGSVTANLVPSNATNSAVTWSSNDTSVATVDSAGNITAVSVGTATITVTTQDGGFTDTCSVTVSSAMKPEVPVLPSVSANVIALDLDNNLSGKVIVTLGMSGDGQTQYSEQAVVRVEDNLIVEASPTTLIKNGDLAVTGKSVGQTSIIIDFLDSQAEILHTEKIQVTVTSSNPVNPSPNNTSSSSGSSNNGGSNIQDKAGIIVVQEKPYTKAQFNKDWKVADKTNGNVIINAKNFTYVTGDVLDYIYNTALLSDRTITVQFDQVKNNSIITRIYVTPQQKNEKIILNQDDKTSSTMQKIFNNFFANEIATFSFGNTSIKVAIKPPNELDTENLVVYSYNRENNTYTKIAYRIDNNGFVHLDAPTGDFIFSNGDFSKKGFVSK